MCLVPPGLGAPERGGAWWPRSEQPSAPTRAARTSAVRQQRRGRWRRAPAGHMEPQLALRPRAPAQSRLVPAARTALVLPVARRRAPPSRPARAGPTAALLRLRPTRLRRVPVAAATAGGMAAAMATAATTRRRGTAGPDRVTVVLLTLASFLAVLALLAWQLRTSATVGMSPSPVARRVYQTTVVETVVGPSQRSGSSVTQSVSSSGSSSGPATRAS